MARNATGTVEWVPAKKGEPQGHYKARVTASDGSRPWIHLDPGPCSPTAEKSARRKAEAWTERVRAEGIVAVPRVTRRRGVRARKDGSETVAEYAKRWLEERRARGLTSVDENRKVLETHALPRLAEVAIRDVTKRDVVAFVEYLDDSVQADRIRWKTAQNIFGVLSKMLADACNSKRLDLRVRDDDPAAGVRGPDRGDEREGPYLYPLEAARLLACDEIPVRFRAIYALALYTGLRKGELAVLRAEHVSLAGGYVHVTKAHNRLTGEDKGTKGRRGRRVPFAPTLKPLLEAMLRIRPTGHLVDVPDRTLADTIRRHVEAAGVDRAELFSDDDQRAPVNFHSMRHTYATWLALAGTDALVIQQRGGWADFDLVNRYVEEAEAVGRGDIGTPFPEVPASLVAALQSSEEYRPQRVSESLSGRRKRRKTVGGTGIEPATSGL